MPRPRECCSSPSGAGGTAVNGRGRCTRSKRIGCCGDACVSPALFLPSGRNKRLQRPAAAAQSEGRNQPTFITRTAWSGNGKQRAAKGGYRFLLRLLPEGRRFESYLRSHLLSQVKSMTYTHVPAAVR